MTTDRRTFLQLLSTGALATAFPASIQRALAIPANNKTGTIDDVEHIVIMMQENRSFDHYFGTLRGVRGYGDPRTMLLPSGKPLWYQPVGVDTGLDYVLPFHPSAPNLGLQFIEDLAHDWTTTHAAWNQGKYDQWVPTKGTTTMAHLTRSDIPFHYALADAFTVCDGYHCSLLGPTDPNRYYMWTGWVGNDGNGGGPVVDNAEAGYDWSTYPELLQKAGVSWKIYQDVGEGLTAAGSWGWTGDDAYIGNYGDNSLLYFHQYQNAATGTPLAEKAKTGTDISVKGTLFDVFKADVANGTLPQVSWVVAPEAYTEHPNWPANYGAWYVSQILDALTANPEVWSKTAFFLTYDENDGFFDHVVPPTVPPTSSLGKSTVSTVNEIFAGSDEYPAGPYGMGVRVPMVVISPWSKGGYVDSEVFDHTSLIRFIEKRFGPHYAGLTESNITPWRRAVAGDLTSAFNFACPNAGTVPLPSTTAYIPPDNNRHPDYYPVPPVVQAMPVQEPGIRPARALPYNLHAAAQVDLSAGTILINFQNLGKATAVFQVRSGNKFMGPWTYTVEPQKDIHDTWSLGTNLTGYDFLVYGPNGYFREFKGSMVPATSANLDIVIGSKNDGQTLTMEILNQVERPTVVSVLDVYTGKTTKYSLAVGGSVKTTWRLEKYYGWYDLVVTVASDQTFKRHIAGHVENGKDSMTDPAIGASAS